MGSHGAVFFIANGFFSWIFYQETTQSGLNYQSKGDLVLNHQMDIKLALGHYVQPMEHGVQWKYDIVLNQVMVFQSQNAISQVVATLVWNLMTQWTEWFLPIIFRFQPPKGLPENRRPQYPMELLSCSVRHDMNLSQIYLFSPGFPYHFQTPWMLWARANFTAAASPVST